MERDHAVKVDIGLLNKFRGYRTTSDSKTTLIESPIVTQSLDLLCFLLTSISQRGNHPPVKRLITITIPRSRVYFSRNKINKKKEKE